MSDASGRKQARLWFSLASTAVAVLGSSLVVAAQGRVPELVVTQLPADAAVRSHSATGGTLPSAYGDGGRIVRIGAGAKPEVLTEGFHSACDPDVSFDGRRMLFSGKREPGDPWNVFEMNLEDSSVRQVTRDFADCRNPVYQGTLYTITSSEPWNQITFVGNRSGEINEYGSEPSTSLYSCRTDGSEIRRLTFNPSSDLSPSMLPDGRLLFSGWQRRSLDRGVLGRVSLFASHIDGLDFALFVGDPGRRVKLMPCVTPAGLVVFVEADRVGWDGAGTLAAVTLRRNHHSYRPLTSPDEGLFHSPSPLRDGSLLVSRRPADGSGTHGVYRFDPGSRSLDRLFDDPDRHDVQAKALSPRPMPDGRSSVVSPGRPNGGLYCLNVYRSDLGDGWIAPGEAKRLRVLEGLPRRRPPGPGARHRPGLLPRRILGIVPVAKDGSFNVEVPANVAIELQLLDEDGLALRSCGWIWVGSREVRGCIGCHEDPESTPENRFVEAVQKPAIGLTLPPHRRRVVDFRRDVLPVLSRSCAAPHCHAGDARPALSASPSRPQDVERVYERLLAAPPDDSSSVFGRYVHAGCARTSPLIWHVLGRVTSRPWDPVVPRRVASMPPPGHVPVSASDQRTLAEWIDLGALPGVPVPDGGAPGAPE